MNLAIHHYIQRFAQPPQAQLDAFVAQGREVLIGRNKRFVEAGDVCDKVAFIHQGIVRYHLITRDGDDITKDFGFANWFTVAFTSALTKQPSQVLISTVTDVSLTVWPFDVLIRLFDADIEWQKFGRRMAEMLYFRKEEREIEFLVDSATARYQRMLQRFPHEVARIPQHYLASYLGITPESLSRIRKGIDLHQ